MTEERKVPKREQHARTILYYLDEHADTQGNWQGSLMDVLNELSIPHTYYSEIVNLLKRSGTAAQVSRGGGNRKSVWTIVDKDGKLEGVKYTPFDARKATLETRLTNLENLVGGIDIKQALFDLAKEVRGNDG